jgi:integrase/recombinase XerD
MSSITYKEEERSAQPISPLASHIERFIQERRYLKGVSPATEEWYRYSFKAFSPVLDTPHKNSMGFKCAVASRIATLRETPSPNSGRRCSAVTVNTYLRCLKAFLRWCHEEKLIDEPIRLAWLKEPSKILPTFSPEQIKRLIEYRPTSPSGRRLHMMALVAIDTGLRIAELLSLMRSGVDLDNLVLRVMGKGAKERLVPISLDLRKRLYRYLSSHTAVPGSLVFATKYDGQLSQRDVLRDFKKLAKRAGLDSGGVRCSFHTLRHTFAVSYLRSGGNLYFLQRILGHSSLATTEKYLRSLGVADLQAVHDRLSPLAGRKGATR